MDKPERIAKVIARSGICSRRDAEKLIEAGKVIVNGSRITSPALNVSAEDKITVNGKGLEQKDKSRLWLYYKPVGLVTSHRDEKGRPTVFEAVAKDLPRVISVGRLDINTEGLLLLTNDGSLARYMELPSTGWKRRYRARVYGALPDESLARLKAGITVEGVKYGPIDVVIEAPDKLGRNLWVKVTLAEGKNREIRKVFDHLGCTVNRLMRISYGPFTLSTLSPGDIREVPQKMLKEQLGNIVF